MTTKLGVYVIEVDGIEPQVSAIKPPLLPGSKLRQFLKFTDQRSFLDGMMKIGKAMEERPFEKKLLIISAHGVPRTGTRLALPSGELDLRFFAPVFQQISECTIFISACFGGYPGSIQAARAFGKVAHCVISPMVDMKGTHVAELQTAIYGILSQEELFEPFLVTLANSQNEAWREGYEGRDAVRFVTSDDEWHPRPLGKQLAAPVKAGRFRLIALQQFNKLGEPTIAVLYDGESYWTTSPASLPEEALALGLQEVIGSEIVSSVQLVEPKTTLRNPGKLVLHDARLENEPVMEETASVAVHCGEFDPADLGSAPLPLDPQRAALACLACNWAKIDYTSVLKEDERTMSVAVACLRSECDWQSFCAAESSE